MIGVNNKLELPGGFNFISCANPSQFAYTPNVEPPNVEKTTKVSTVVLSTTNRVKAREAARRGEKMDLDEIKETKEEEEEHKEEEKVEEEPAEELLTNPSRVLNQ